jgi:hypothetical protein
VCVAACAPPMVRLVSFFAASHDQINPYCGLYRV